MDTNCHNCRFAKLTFLGEFLNVGEYQCALGADTGDENCASFQPDVFSEDEDYDFAS